MAIKAAARRPWGAGGRFATTWYEPQPSSSRVASGVRFALSTPGVHAFCTPGDLSVLSQALDAAEAFSPMSSTEWSEAIEAASDDPLIFPMPV